MFNSARFNSCLFNGTPVPRQFSHSIGGDLSIDGGQTIACQYVVAEGGDLAIDGATSRNILHRGGAVTTSQWDWARVRSVA